MINCSIAPIGNRYFICIGNEIFPLDRISYIDAASLDINNTERHAVKIELSNPNEEFVWEQNSDASAIRKFLRGLNLNVEED